MSELSEAIAEVLKFNRNHYPKGSSKGGQFAPSKGGKGGSTGGGKATYTPSKGFDKEAWKAKGMGDARKEWMGMPEAERDRIADPVRSIPKRMNELTGIRREYHTGNTHTDIAKAVQSYDGKLADTAVLHKMTKDLHQDLIDSGADPVVARRIALDSLHHVAAQEFEGMGRTLGDHGIMHLNGDAEVAIGILEASGNSTPALRAQMRIAAVYHDTGYMAPPSQVFLDEGHPRWSQQYFDAHIHSDVSQALGKKTADDISSMILHHADTDIDWKNDLAKSAFSTGDNMALFHKEKMPPLLRYVPANTTVLARLGAGKLSVEETHKQMHANIDAANLPEDVKARFHEAVREVSGVLPKFTLGMIGVSLDSRPSWEGDHPKFTLKRHKANELLGKVLDLNSRQFVKLAETYGESADNFIQSGHMKVGKDKTLLEAVIEDYIRKMIGLAFKYNKNHFPKGSGKGGQFAPGKQGSMVGLHAEHPKAGTIEDEDALINGIRGSLIEYNHPARIAQTVEYLKANASKMIMPKHKSEEAPVWKETEMNMVHIGGITYYYQEGMEAKAAKAVNYIALKKNPDNGEPAINAAAYIDNMHFFKEPHASTKYWEKRYNRPNMSIAAVGGNRSITFLNNNDFDRNVYHHEMGHNIGSSLFGSGSKYPNTYDFMELATNHPISEYGRVHPVEYFAELSRIVHTSGKNYWSSTPTANFYQQTGQYLEGRALATAWYAKNVIPMIQTVKD